MSNYNENDCINCTITPNVPKRLELVSHDTRLGDFRLDPSRIRLFKSCQEIDPYYQRRTSPSDIVDILTKDPSTIPGWRSGMDILHSIKSTIFKEGYIPLPANVLDYLLSNPDKIPEEWSEEAPLFIGTLYRGYTLRDDYSKCIARDLRRNPIYTLKEGIEKEPSIFRRSLYRALYPPVYLLNAACALSTYHTLDKFVGGDFDFDEFYRGTINITVPACIGEK